MKKRIPLNVLLLGIVSFFNDIASEMVYPIIPIFLTTVLHVSVPIVGLIEGIAEATASIGKYIFGALSDYFQKRKLFVVLGYFFSSISKLMIGVASTWPVVLIARFMDRSGKGIRTAPRDSILLENTESHNRGFIFGFHRAMDSMGAIVGPLLALILLYLYKENMRFIFLIAFIPSIIGVVLLILFVREKAEIKNLKTKPKLFTIDLKKIAPKLKLFLIISFIFALGNSSDAFLILKAKNLGLTTLLAVLAYVLYNIVQTVVSTPAGQLADKLGPKKVYAIGLIIFASVYFTFGLINSSFWVWILFPLYGFYIAFTDGVSKAYVSQFITQESSGSYFGMQQMLTAVGNFIASFVGGLLWSAVHPAATFLYGGIMAIVALSIFLFV